MKLHEWLQANADTFIGALKINDEKRPLKGETKADNWLFHEDNLPADRMREVVEFAKEDSSHSCGVLVPNDILVIDLDNKADGINGVKRWAELSDIPFNYKSSSGKGAHLWVKNPFNDTIKSTYAKVSKKVDDKAIELFSGHKQYIKLPNNNDFDWSTIDLANLPELPKGFLKGVSAIPDASKVDPTLTVDKLEIKGIAEVHHYLVGIAAPDDYASFFALTSTMFALAFYQENVKNNKNNAEDIKELWERKCQQSDSFNAFTNNNQWDAMAYLGAIGKGMGFLHYSSSFGSYPRGITPAQAALRAKDWKDFTGTPEVVKPVTPFSVMD